MKSNGRILVKAPKEYPGKRHILNWIPRAHCVYWENTGCIIKDDEVIHHIDENMTNDSFENLQLMKRNEHSALHCKGALIGVFECPVCKTTFEREMSNVRDKERNNRPVLCSQKCGGKIYGTGKPLHNYTFKIEKTYIASVSE